MNILIVIQDDAQAGNVRAVLASDGHQTTRVSTHAEGLSRAADSIPDVVIYGPAGKGGGVSGFRKSLESRVRDRAIPVLAVGPGDTAERIHQAIQTLVERMRRSGGDAARTVLVVDDKKANRRRLASQFAGDGWKVLEAEDGRSGALLLIDHAVDCLLVNAVLSGKSSCDLVRSAAEIRKVHPHPYSILVMADAEDSQTAGRMIKSGADDVVGRTMGASLLRRRLDCALHLRDLRRENRALKERLAAFETASH